MTIEFLEARFEHGRWLVDCVHCNGAELARPGQPFLCGSHFADEAAARRPQEPGLRSRDIARQRGQQYPVRFPPQQSQIESRLRRLPRQQMHWRPGDPIQGSP